MPRNGSGTYDLPEAPFEPNTAIESAAVNDDFSDIGDALTGSVASDGQTPITGALKLANAGVVYNADPNTGVRRVSSDTQAIVCGGTDIVTIDVNGIDVDGTIKSNGIILLPPGVIVPYGGAAAPAGWLLCYGQSLLRATYADLFTAIGTTYGSADGTHFSLPDLRGRDVAGKDDMGGTPANRLTATYFGTSAAVLGAVGGSESHILSTAEIPAHTHGVTDAGHTHTIPTDLVTGSGVVSVNNQVEASSHDNQLVTNSATTGIVINNAGGGGAHAIVQPTIITNYIIYAGV